MTIGLPGSGKTTFVRSLGGYHVSSDDLREEGFDDPWNEMGRRTIEHLKAGETVIYDATNLTRKKRRSILCEAKKYTYTVALVMLTPLSECLERNSQRGRKEPEEVILKYMSLFEYPTPNEFDTVLVCQDSIDPLKIEDIPQDNPHHKYSLLEHLRLTARYVAEEAGYADYALLQAAGAHDIGKYVTKSFTDYKGNPTEHAHYYGHENAGAYMWFTSNMWSTENEHIGRLINYHMRPFRWSSPKARKRDEEDFGPELTHELEIINRADIKASGGEQTEGAK